MANGWGGSRSGSGRPRGARNKRLPLAQVKRLRRELPLDYMLRILNDKKQPDERRDKMAALAAPYLHARLIATGAAKTPGQMETEELEDVIARTQAEFARRDGAQLRLAVDNAKGGR
jgi:hypothetical protein